jgi:hypothetical protein
LFLLGFFLFPALAFSADPAPAASGASSTSSKSAGEKKYIEVSQGDLSSGRENYDGKDVLVAGQFLFTGSDFCYQIRGTKINTRDYFCFAFGPVSLVRFYLKKDHPQVDELMKVKKGSTIKAYGTFDSIGNDYKYVVVDRFEVIAK